MGNEGFVRITGYCMHCRKRKEIKDLKVEDIKYKRGIRKLATGICPDCKGKMAKFLKIK